MILYHVTTPKKARKYHETGFIRKPVRGFNTLLGAMIWAIRTGRSLIYKVDGEKAYMLPDHHNEGGNAYWINADIPLDKIKCVRKYRETIYCFYKMLARIQGCIDDR